MQESTTAITFFSSAIDKKAYPWEVGLAVSSIQGEGHLNVTSQYRLMTPGKARDKFKRTSFKAVCWSVSKFKDNTRAIDNCLVHSGLICLDIDKLEDEKYQYLIQHIPNDPYTHICFTSPSGNGIKVVIKIEADAQKHLTYFQSLARYYDMQYSVDIDQSGKDVSRLCFICHDPDVFYNPDSALFDLSLAPAGDDTSDIKEPVRLNTIQERQLKKNTGTTVNDVFEFTQNVMQYQDGQRNKFVHLFGCNCNRKGIDQSDAETFALSFATDLDAKEVKDTIKSAYKLNTHEHAKFAPKNRTETTNRVSKSGTKGGRQGNQKTQKASGSGVVQPEKIPLENSRETISGNRSERNDQSGNSGIEGEVIFDNFWNRNINEKTGKEHITLNYTRFYDFLENQGYCNLKIDNQNVELVRVENNIVTPVIINKNRNDVKSEMNRYCKSQDFYDVLEMLHRGQSKYFSREQFINIGYREIEFNKDTKDVSYHYHSNCVVEARATGITVREYQDGEKCMWASQINPRPFIRHETQAGFTGEERILADDTECEFAKYQILASCHPKADVSADTANKRYLSHATSFGYLINNFKPVDGPAIVGVDHHLTTDRSEQNGRTGKGIFSKALGHVTRRFAVDGRKFDPKDQSVFEGLTMDCKVITVDDCSPRFDFGHFFVPITEDFTIRKMYVGYITIPYDYSPKWYFNTNFTFMGDGHSFNARQHVIEFDNFFNNEYTPIHYFGHTLFREWDEHQWNLFYNYAYECDCLYKSIGLVKYAEGNYMERKLINECPVEFIDFMDASDDGGTALNFYANAFFPKLEFLAKWNDECKSNNMQQSSSKQLFNMVKKYCITKGVGFFQKKTNGQELYYIGNKYPAPLTKGIKVILPIKDQPIPKLQVEMF